MKLLFCLPLAIAAASAQTAFYALSGTELLPRSNGDLIRSQPLAGAPEGASAYRVLYRSEGLKGQPIAVSGVVFIPAGPAPPEGRPIVAWAHPTTGIQPKCAPSQSHFLFESIQGLRQMLRRGFVVTATDYPGLGTAGPHPFLVGASEGRAVLDSVRVARLIAPEAGRRFAVWGHSQGGHAALYAGLLAEEYAQDLQLSGVAAAAPATELAALLGAGFDTAGGRNLTAMTLWSWSRVYGTAVPEQVTPEGVQAMDRLAGDCIETVFDVLIRKGPAKELARTFSIPSDLAATRPWTELLAENTPRLLPVAIPLFLAQGERDRLVLPRVTRDYQAKQCAVGSAVEFFSMPGIGHAFAARDSAKVAIQWIADRFAGEPAPSNCPAGTDLQREKSF